MVNFRSHKGSYKFNVGPIDTSRSFWYTRFYKGFHPFYYAGILLMPLL